MSLDMIKRSSLSPKTPRLGTTKPTHTDHSNVGRMLQWPHWVRKWAREDGNARDQTTTHPANEHKSRRRSVRTLRLALALEMLYLESTAHRLHSGGFWTQQRLTTANVLHVNDKQKEARGQEQYKVKAIHTLESLPPLLHCRTVLGSQTTTRRVAVNANYLKVQGRRVKFPNRSWLYAVPVTHTFSTYNASLFSRI